MALNLEKEHVETLQIGSSNFSEYLAFGDDSQFKHMLVYAFIFVRRSKLAQVEDALLKLKRKFKVPDNVTLHCRELFHIQQRVKAGIGHLSDNDVRLLIARVIKIINRFSIILRFAYCDYQEAEKIFKESNFEIELANKDPEKGATKIPAKPDRKGIQAFLANACCFGVPQNGAEGPTPSECQIVISADKTKVEFFGTQRRQAHNWSRGFSDIGAAKNTVFQLAPTIMEADGAPLLQIADIVSYICSHSLILDDSTSFFQEQLNFVTHWFRKKFIMNLNHNHTK